MTHVRCARVSFPPVNSAPRERPRGAGRVGGPARRKPGIAGAAFRGPGGGRAASTRGRLHRVPAEVPGSDRSRERGLAAAAGARGFGAGALAVVSGGEGGGWLLPPLPRPSRGRGPIALRAQAPRTAPLRGCSGRCMKRGLARCLGAAVVRTRACACAAPPPGSWPPKAPHAPAPPPAMLRCWCRARFMAQLFENYHRARSCSPCPCAYPNKLFSVSCTVRVCRAAGGGGGGVGEEGHHHTSA